MPDYTVVTLAEKPELTDPLYDLSRAEFPHFIFESDAALKANWRPTLEKYPEYQFLFFEGEELIAGGITIPLLWDGSLDDLPDTTAQFFTGGDDPTTLCALAGLVPGPHRGRGLSRRILLEMRNVAQRQGFASLIAPVRPNHKTNYPLIPMETYLSWRRDDGLLYDPWMRVHERLGAKYLRIMPAGVNAKGTVAEWEEWTGLTFQSSGEYVIPGALNPIRIDLQKNEGVYIEPNVWMEHRIGE